MKVENGKIVEITDDELFSYYLKHEWYEIYDYPTYKEKCKEKGTKIIGEDGEFKYAN